MDAGQHAVKCVAGASQFLASGGADDTIHLYDIQHDKDLGFLMNPGDGAIPCLKFFTPASAAAATHMFSGSADGSISIWNAGGGWEHLKTMRGHKSSVNDLTVHKSGRLALSVGRDSSIRMWNLLKGRCPYTAQLELEGDIVSFLPGGDAYVLICGSQVTVHGTSGEGGVLSTMAHTRRVQCMAQTCDEVLMTGVEDGSVKVWDLRTSTCSHSMERVHTSRVRGLAVLEAGAGKMPEVFTTASSDGVVKVWDSRMLSSSGASRCLAAGSTQARITCLCVVQPVAAANPGSKQARAKAKKAQAKLAVGQTALVQPKTKPAAGTSSSALGGSAATGEPKPSPKPSPKPKAQALLKPKKLISKVKGGGLVTKRAPAAASSPGAKQVRRQGIPARPKPSLPKGKAGVRGKKK